MELVSREIAHLVTLFLALYTARRRGLLVFSRSGLVLVAVPVVSDRPSVSAPVQAVCCRCRWLSARLVACSYLWGRAATLPLWLLLLPAALAVSANTDSRLLPTIPRVLLVARDAGRRNELHAPSILALQACAAGAGCIRVKNLIPKSIPLVSPTHSPTARRRAMNTI